MEFCWVITKDDVHIYRDFIERNRSADLVQERIARNVKHRGVVIS
jgi:predicted transcriptional regulator